MGNIEVTMGSSSLRRGDEERGRGDLAATHLAQRAPRVVTRVRISPASDSQYQYITFSLWDTFRAAHPLYTIIDQKRTVDFINTFIRIYEQGGRLPVWELWGEETDTMIGYHAVSVIADAMAKDKGFRLREGVRSGETLGRARSLRPRRLQKARLYLDGGRERIGVENARVRLQRLVIARWRTSC